MNNNKGIENAPSTPSQSAEQAHEYLKERFDTEPSFAQLWEMCVYNLLYNEKEYANDVEGLFKTLNITKNSRIVDVASGSGFPALALAERGYSIDAFDGFKDQAELYNTRAAERGVDTTCQQVLWQDLPNTAEAERYDLAFCRGNSFIYALGGWNELAEIDGATALLEYTRTAKIFYDLIKPGGHLYIDKFKDTEVSHKDKVAEIQVADGESEDLVFWTERFPEQKIRRASMLRITSDGTETGTPNISYDLTIPELKSVLLQAGFTSVEEISIPSETTFTVLLAHKIKGQGTFPDTPGVKRCVSGLDNPL